MRHEDEFNIQSFHWEGKEAFHLLVYQDRWGDINITSTIPTELIQHVYPTFYCSLKKIDAVDSESCRKLVKTLGKALLDYNELASSVEMFFYPDYLLKNGKISNEVLGEVFKLLEGFVVPRDTFFCSTHNSVMFFVMTLNIERTRIYSIMDFFKRVHPISKEEFEMKLDTNQLKEVYVEHYSKDLKYVQLYDEGVLIYMLLDNEELPLLILSH